MRFDPAFQLVGSIKVINHWLGFASYHRCQALQATLNQIMISTISAIKATFTEILAAKFNALTSVNIIEKTYQ
ncbi:MAG: hypothetical protein IGS23_06280 [Rivularia sp. T60_A2020_040]|nr:hypothetical protein [Rivularia sp. T60_A2020_040]